MPILECAFNGLAYPRALGGPATLRSLLDLSIKLLRNKHLKATTHISMLTYSVSLGNLHYVAGTSTDSFTVDSTMVLTVRVTPAPLFNF
jgi:hypothetical protein